MWTEIAISTAGTMSTGETCGSVEHTLRHEMVHALAPMAEHLPSGVFAAGGDRSVRFDAGAVALICGSIGCAQ
jgi:hypothetical protein